MPKSARRPRPVDLSADLIAAATLPADVDPSKPFTRDLVFRLTPAQIGRFWVEQQRIKRAAGEAHYDTLRDGKTDEVYATV